MLLVVQNWSKMTHLPQQQGPPLEISHIVLVSVMTHCFHRLYQILSLETDV